MVEKRQSRFGITYIVTQNYEGNFMQKGYFKTRREANDARKKGEVVFFSKINGYYLRKPRTYSLKQNIEDAVRKLLELSKERFKTWRIDKNV